MTHKQTELNRLRALEIKYTREQRSTPNLERSIPSLWSREYQSALAENGRLERLQAKSDLLSNIELDKYYLLNPDHWTPPDTTPLNDDDSLIKDHILLTPIPKLFNVNIPSTCPSEFNIVKIQKSDTEQRIHPPRYHLTEQEQKDNPLLTISECIQYTDSTLNANWFYAQIISHRLRATWHIVPDSDYKQPRVAFSELQRWNLTRVRYRNQNSFNHNTISLIQDFKDPEYYEVFDWYRTLGYVSYSSNNFSDNIENAKRNNIKNGFSKNLVLVFDINKNPISSPVRMTEAFSILFENSKSHISSPKIRKPYRSFTEKTERRDEILICHESFAARYEHGIPSLTSISTWEPSSMLAKERSIGSLSDLSKRKLPKRK